MINVAVIGAGAISSLHIEGYLAFPGRCRIVSVVDIDRARAERQIARYGLGAAAVGDAVWRWYYGDGVRGWGLRGGKAGAPFRVTVDPGGPNERVLPGLVERQADELGDRYGLPPRLIRQLRMLPSYYLRYYYLHDEVLAEQRASGTRAAEVAAIEKELLDLYADATVDSKPTLLERRGGAFYSEAAVELVASLLGDRRDRQVVNLRNDGTLPFLPDDAVVEDGGARVFIQRDAASIVDDRELDAQLDEEGRASFMLGS